MVLEIATNSVCLNTCTCMGISHFARQRLAANASSNSAHLAHQP